MTTDGLNCTQHSDCNLDVCQEKCCSNDESSSDQFLCPQEECNQLTSTGLTLSPSAIVAIVLCVINIPRKHYSFHSTFIRLIFNNKQSDHFSVMAIIILVYSRYKSKRRPRLKHNNNTTEDDVRENIVSYADEGGEDDMKAYDLASLRIQISGAQTPNRCYHFANNYNKSEQINTKIASEYIFTPIYNSFLFFNKFILLQYVCM